MQGSSSVKRPHEQESFKKTPVKKMKKKKPRKKRYLFLKLLILILLCMVGFMVCALNGYKYIVLGTQQAEVVLTETTGDIYNIPSGSSPADIADDLYDKGYIKDVKRYKLLSKVMGFNNAYRAGNFLIEKGINEYALMLRLTDEPLKNPTKDIMIPEGKTLLETVETLHGQGYVDKGKFMKIASTETERFSFLKDLKATETRPYVLEGYLYPDTYKLDEGWTEQQLIDMMLNEFNRIFTQDFKARAEELGMTIDEVVTMASLIEMEARYPTDYKKISSVFHNRLNSQYKKLESDATVQYARIYAGLGRTSSLLYKDLEIESLYNTYKYEGLPPGPICSPRVDAIEAALYPEKTNYLFFFATPDGTNIYNETYEGHVQDQAKYGVSGN